MEATAPWVGMRGRRERTPWTALHSPHSEGRRRGRGMGPWGFGPPPQAWQWFGGPGGRRPRFRRGDVRLAVLTLLAEQPMHGYQIIGELTARSGGAWRPSPGSVYPTLQQLEDEGLVTVSEQDGRRTFSLTDAGREEVERATAGRPAPWEQLAEQGCDDRTATLRRRGGELMAAVLQVANAGSDEQVDRAARILADARRALYRLLAEDDDTSEGGAG